MCYCAGRVQADLPLDDIVEARRVAGVAAESDRILNAHGSNIPQNSEFMRATTRCAATAPWAATGPSTLHARKSVCYTVNGPCVRAKAYATPLSLIFCMIQSSPILPPSFSQT